MVHLWMADTNAYGLLCGRLLDVADVSRDPVTRDLIASTVLVCSKSASLASEEAKAMIVGR